MPERSTLTGVRVLEAKCLIRQAFHWFSNIESLQEIHRVIKPHGAFGALWNIEDYNAPRSHKASSSWEAKLHEVIWSFDDDQPRFRHEKWRRVFDEQIKSNPISVTTSANPLFALPLGEHVQQWEIWLSKDAVWDRYNTLSQIAILEGEEREVSRNRLANSATSKKQVANVDGHFLCSVSTKSSRTQSTLLMSR